MPAPVRVHAKKTTDDDGDDDDNNNVPPSSSFTTASTDPAADGLIFYPAYCYKVSPTWFKWVKLTIFDLHHRLEKNNTFPSERRVITTNNGAASYNQQSSLLLFYLNHPIQFVQLVGIVVSFDSYFEKFWLFSLDDSSGATVDVHCRKPDNAINNGEQRQTISSDQTETDADADADAAARHEIMTKLDIGAVVTVKGQITTFRNVRQLHLDRLTLVTDTNHEMSLIASRTHFYKSVLSQPWVVPAETQRTLHKRALGEDTERDERRRKRQKMQKQQEERERRHAARIAREYKREETERQRDAERAREAGRLFHDQRQQKQQKRQGDNT